MQKINLEDVRYYLPEGRAIDLFVIYRFLRILTTPWEEQPAFEHGIIDKEGKLLRKANTLSTGDEKKSFTLLHRLVFNLKRILHKVPLVKTKLGTYATALFLLKQHFENQVEEEDTIEKAFTNWLVDSGYITNEEISDQISFTKTTLEKGRYSTINEKNNIVLFKDEEPIDNILGENIYKVVNQKTSNEIYVSLQDLKKINI